VPYFYCYVETLPFVRFDEGKRIKKPLKYTKIQSNKKRIF